MPVAAMVTSGLLAAAIAYAAARKLTHAPEVVAEYERAGVPEPWLNWLAALLFAGALGLLGGIAWSPVGTAAAACLAVYFAVAITFHARNRDLANVATPIALGLLAIATVVFRLA